MYAKTLSAYDFRCFGKAKLSLQYPGRSVEPLSRLVNINLILGDNGGGKSSVLRALAIAALAPALLYQGFVAHRLVRRSKEDASNPDLEREALLKINAVIDPNESDGQANSSGEIEMLARIAKPQRGDVDRLHLNSTPGSPIERLLSDDYSDSFFMVGYGATRRIETGDFSESSQRKSRGLRYQRVASLFEDQVALRPLQSWAPRVTAERWNEVVALVNATLPPQVRLTGNINPEDGQYRFLFNGLDTPFSSLSDGYKTFVGWVTDLIGHLCDVTRPGLALTSIKGIVLVDEIDLHLHPEWQRSVVPTLASAFPNLQFVMTTHSPIVASTVQRQNVFLTETDEKELATIVQLDENIFGRTAEQLLLSSYFGLQTTRPEAFQAHAEDLFKRAALGDSQAALAYLEELKGSDESDWEQRFGGAIA